MPIRNWGKVRGELSIMYAGRLSDKNYDLSLVNEIEVLQWVKIMSTAMS